LLIVQARNNGGLLEAARYANGSCTTCTDLNYANTTDTKVSKRETLNVALIGTLSGTAQATGQAALHGAQLAIREINDKGGIIGSNNTRYTFVLITYDVSTPSAAADAVKKAKDAGAAIILGPDYNGQILPSITQASSQSIAQLVSATSADVTATDTADYVFGLRTNDEQLSKAALKYLLDERSLTRFATFAVRTDYGLNTINAVKDQIKASDDGQVVASVDHNLDQADYAAYAKELTAANPEVIVAWTTQPAFKGLLDAIGKTGWKGTVVYGYLTADYAKTLTVPANVELIGAVSWWDSAQDWASVDFVNRYTSYYGTAPLIQSAVYYDAIHMIAHGVKESGAKASDLRSWINKQTSFKGVQGAYTPSTYGDGELSRAVLLLRVSKGGISEIARYNDGACWVNCGK
jgi:branched-chain amino acid transport system substrate-binding protein